MAIPSASRLDEIGVLELLKYDDRPTFVLENGLHFPGFLNTNIVFRNAALNDYLRRDDKVVDFEDWARTLSADAAHKGWTFGGRAWTSTHVQHQYIIVYCSQSWNNQAFDYGSEVQPHTRNRIAATPRPRNASVSSTTNSLVYKPSQVFSDAGDTDSLVHAVPIWSRFADTDGANEAKVIDWTRHYIDDLPPFIKFIREFNWSATSLGPISGWPDSLRRVVVCMFSVPDPRVIIWGQDMVLLYNEAAIPRLGRKHPSAMGRSLPEAFSELWPQFAPIIKPSILEGRSLKLQRELLFMERSARLEETYWNVTMAPLLGDHGYAEGALDSFTEQTTVVISQRRRDIIADVARATSNVTTLKALWVKFMDALILHGTEIPYAMIYAMQDVGDGSTTSTSSSIATRYTLESTLGLQADETVFPEFFDINEASSELKDVASICRRARDLRQTVTLQSEDSSLPACFAISIPGRGWGDIVNTVCAVPVAMTANGALGFLILALNPRRPMNEDAMRFAHNLRDALAKPAWLMSQQRYEEMNDSLAQQLRRSALEAARSESKFTRLAESAPIGICTFGSDGKTLYVNDEYLEMLGVSRQHDNISLWDTDNVWIQQVVEEDLPVVRETWQNLVERKVDSTTTEYRMKRPWRSLDKATGEEMIGETWLCNKATAEIGDDDNVLYIHSWLLNVSHQHYSEDLMKQRLELAQENKRQSENFIDMVSHELRNPLSAILQSADGILTTLEEGPQQDLNARDELRHSVVEAAQTIVLCAQHQSNIVTDILTLSKLDSNLLMITPDKVQPPSLIQKVLQMYEADMKSKAIEACLEIDKSFTNLLHNHDYVMLDPSRLLQVIINLLTNAIKFTQYQEERKITIYLGASYETPGGETHNLTFIDPSTRPEHNMSLSSEWGTGEDIFLEVTVKDTGRGLDEDEIKLLFQRFSQASPKTYKQYGGSGLGLFISRELCHLQGGSIGVSSEGLGMGSTFAFYVRARRLALSDSAECDTPVVSQDAWTTTGTDSAGEDANVLSPSSAIGTPESEISRRSSSSLAPGKPRLSRVPTNRRTPPSVDGNPERQRLHVLIVEDNLINQKVMAQQLRRIGCVVHIANHGLECLAFLQKTPFWDGDAPTSAFQDIEPPSLQSLSTDGAMTEAIPLSVVLMDWEMPTMDGLTCVREMRRLQASGHLVAHVPTIAVTANARGEQISLALEAGMDDLVTKPFRIPDLVPLMETLAAKYPAPSFVLTPPSTNASEV